MTGKSPEPSLGPPQPKVPPSSGSGSADIFGRLKTAAFHDLVAAALANDRHAIGTLFAWIHPAIIRYCRARIGRTRVAYSSADDVAQEVCLAVCTALHRFNDEPQSFLPFVYGIAAHKVADHYRRAGRDRSEPTADVPDMVNLESTPEQQAVRADARARLLQLLHILTARQREILALRLMAGLSAQETAAATGMTATGVRVAQHRALAKLRANCVGDDWR